MLIRISLYLTYKKHFKLSCNNYGTRKIKAELLKLEDQVSKRISRITN